MIKSLMTAIAVCLVALSGAQAQTLKIARISYTGSWDALPAIVAAERGFLAQQGVYMSGVAVGSREAVINSLASGATDFAVLSQSALLEAAAANAPVKAIAINDWGNAHLLVASQKGGVKNVTDLKGKTIALVAGEDGVAVLGRLLNANDIAVSDVKLKYYNPGALGAAFDDGADAAIAEQQIASLLLENKNAKQLMSGKEIAEAIGYIGAQPLIASPRVLQEEPELVAAVQRAWVAAKKHIQDEPEDAARLLRIYLHRRGITIEETQAVQWVKMQRYDLDKWDENVLADANYNAWALAQAKLIKEAPKLDQFVQ